jgi:hypothetical protein
MIIPDLLICHRNFCVEVRFCFGVVEYDGTSDYDVKMRLAIADAECYRIRWIWKDRDLTFVHKKVLLRTVHPCPARRG